MKGIWERVDGSSETQGIDGEWPSIAGGKGSVLV